MQTILTAYELGEARFEPLESADNDVFRVDTEAGRFVLRVHHPFAELGSVKAHVAVEFGWLEHISAASDLVVPRPVRLAGGERFGTIELDGRTRVFVLFEWIEAEPSPPTLDRATAQRMGRAIARLHQTSRDFAPPPEFCAVHWDQSAFFGPDSWIGRGQAQADLEGGRFPLVARAAERIRGAMGALGRDPAHYGLIHSDTHPGNMLLADGEVALIDFNDCGFGHYGLDLGVMLCDLEFMLHMGSGPLERLPELAVAVLAGYEQVAPLPVAERGQLDAFTALRGVSSLGWLARSPDPEERREELRSRPGVPLIFDQLQRFMDG